MLITHNCIQSRGNLVDSWAWDFSSQPAEETVTSLGRLQGVTKFKRLMGRLPQL